MTLATAYIVSLTAIGHRWRLAMTPDSVLVLLAPLLLLLGRFRSWVGDWIPFVGMLLLWEALRSLVPSLHRPITYGSLDAELWVFRGHLPDVAIQGWLNHGIFGRTLNSAATVIYFSHFAVLLGAGMILWLRDRDLFGRYAAAVVMTLFAALLIFAIVPTAPPWWAAEHHRIHGLVRIFVGSVPGWLSAYYPLLPPNDVAALPSMHSAMPFIAFLAVRQLDRRAGRLVLLWTVSMWFCVVYLGEHYVLDAVAGATLAGVGWWLTGTLKIVPRLDGALIRLRTVARAEQ